MDAAPPVVLVRYWAGAKAAAGTAEEHVTAATLGELLAAITSARDERFGRVLQVCSLVVSEQPVAPDQQESYPLREGEVVDVLPPFAGGADRHDPPVTTRSTAPPAALPSWRPPLLSALLGVLLVAGALAGPAYLWIGVAAAQLLLLVSWHRALGALDPVGGMVVAGALILAVDIAIAVEDRQVTFGPIAVVLGVGYLLAIGQQLLRRDGRGDLTASLAATVSLAAIGALGAGWAVLPRMPDGDALTVVAGTAVAGAALGRLLPRVVGALLGPLVLGTAAAVLVARGYPELDGAIGWWIGVAVAAPAALAALVQVRLPARLRGWPASAAWPVLLAAPLAYLVARFVI